MLSCLKPKIELKTQSSWLKNLLLLKFLNSLLQSKKNVYICRLDK